MMPDIVVCGAGPAGSVAAQRLSAAGARVALVGMAPRPGWEGLSSRSCALLAEEGVGVQSGVIAGPFARRGVWAEGRTVEGVEWLMERSRLAEALRIRAHSDGAMLHRDMVASVKREADCWRIGLRGGAALAAPLLIDARGRRGGQRRGPVLLAYGQRWHKPSQGSSGTGIGASDAGWCWWAQHAGSLWVQVVGRPRSRHPAQWLAAARAQIPALARALDGASAEGAPVARPAHARLGVTGQDSTLWQVGDAALALDPLSGQGVYEALRGARLTATAIQSVMEGSDAAVAQRFIAERREEAWLRGVNTAATLYRQNSDRGTFWTDTAAQYAALSTGGVQIARPAVAAQGAPARIERRPVLDRGRIIEREVIVTAEHPRGLWHVGGVPLVALKSYLDAAEHATIAGAATALDRPPSAVTSAIHWLQKTGSMLRQVPPPLSLGG